MKRFLAVLITFVLAVSFAWTAPRQPSFVPVKAKHTRAQRHHRAHKAGKHNPPRRQRHGV